MKHILIILSILLLSSPLLGQSEETCYVVVDSKINLNSQLLSNVSVSLISQFLKEVKMIPPSGISNNECLYEILVTKEDASTFVVLKGKGLNSYGDSKLSGSDGFQQSLLRSLHRALKEKRNLICENYGKFLSEECTPYRKKIVVEKSLRKILYRSRKGGWTIEKNKNSDRVYKGQIKNGLPHGKGETILRKNRLKMIGEFKRGKPWNTNLFNSKGKKVGVWLNGVKQ